MDLEAVGIDALLYLGHSLRIGAATLAAAVRIPDHVIKMLGQCQSEAYHLYIKTPRESLAQVLGSLC